MQSNDLRLLNVSCVLSLVFVLFYLGTVVIGRPFRDFTIYEVYFIGLIFINCLYLRVDLDTIISEFPFFRLLSQHLNTLSKTLMALQKSKRRKQEFSLLRAQAPCEIRVKYQNCNRKKI